MRWVAFLRSINTSGRYVKMEALRAMFAQMGFDQVELFIASGNMIFDTLEADPAVLKTRIEAGLSQAIGQEVATFLRSPEEVGAVARCQPLALAADGQVLYVAFTAGVVSAAARQALLEQRSALDDFAVEGREVYWLRRARESIFSGARLERILGGPATVRNINTVQRLAEKYGW